MAASMSEPNWAKAATSVLGQEELERASDLLHGLKLGGGTDAETEKPTLVAGRIPCRKTPALEKMKILSLFT